MYFTKTPSIAKYLFKSAVWNIPSHKKNIYLTFDDGPTPVITDWTLDVLKKHHAKATFFCIGNNIETHPEIFNKIILDGHRIGNHTFDHLNGWKTSPADYLEDIIKCENIIKKSKRDPDNASTLLFRPPYGKIRKSQIDNIKSKYSIILWDILSGDFDNSISGESCYNNVINNAKAGSIVVFHDSEKAKKNLLFALPKVLAYYSAKGFEFMPLPEDLQ